MIVSRLYNLRSSQPLASSLSSFTSNITNTLPNSSLLTEQYNTLDLNMSDTFYVTPVSELEKLDDWKYQLAFQAAHHHENLNVYDSVEVEWRLRDRV
jgi:hypothetical protein